MWGRKRDKARLAILVIAAFIGIRIIGAVHAVAYGDPYHTHDGKPCLLQLHLCATPGLVESPPDIAAPVPNVVCCAEPRHILPTATERTSHWIRGPPILSS